MKANNNGWTEQRRANQSAMIHSWKPWQYSTGAKTKQGKEKAKVNARRITAKGLCRRMGIICFFREQWEKNGCYLPPTLEARYRAFVIEHDDWIENAPMKRKQ